MSLILDVTPPTINNCPSPIVDVIPIGATTLEVIWTPPTATDNSQQTVSVTLDGGNVGDQFSAGQTVVRYTFNDASMNEAICDVVILLTLGNHLYIYILYIGLILLLLQNQTCRKRSTSAVLV